MSASPATRRIVLIGGTSEIGLATVTALAAQEDQGRVLPVLLGRDEARLREAGEALAARGCAPAEIHHLDADDLDSHPVLFERVFATGVVDTVILAAGVLGGQAALDTPRSEALALLHTDFLGCASLLEAGLQGLRRQRTGHMVVLSSVAGVRPRATLSWYGAAKAGLDALAQSLGDAARADGVRTLVVRPGFVHTRMTAGLSPAPLSTSPDAVAATTVAALARGAHTVWAPPALRWLFLVLGALPRALWRRLPG